MGVGTMITTDYRRTARIEAPVIWSWMFDEVLLNLCSDA